MIARRDKRQASPEGHRKMRRVRTSRAIATPWPVPPVRSAAGSKIAQGFDLPVHHNPIRAPRLTLPPGLALPAPGEIMLITGPRGSG